MPQDTKSNPSNGLVERLRKYAKSLRGPVLHHVRLIEEAADALALYQQEGVLSSQRGENRSANASLRPGLLGPDTEAVDSVAEDFAAIGEWIGLAASALKSGEPYTETCLRVHRKASHALLRLRNTPERSTPWQPIETAPRDGTPVVVWIDGAAYVAEWSAIWAPENKKWLAPHGDRRQPEDMRMVADLGPDLEADGSPSPWGRAGPTHWAPLPASPATPIGGLSLGVEGDQGVSRANSGGTAQAPKSDSDGGH